MRSPSDPIAPEPFLVARVHDLGEVPSITGLCVGFESSEWRASQFVDHLMEWLPEFALNQAELSQIHSGNTVKLIRRAAQMVYESKKFEKRGEFGELFLHVALRQVFKTLPAISKIFFKSARNNTVKGFDAVHVVGPPENMELWLGEAKFYSDYRSAAREAARSINSHIEAKYLRDEFLVIGGKIDSNWPHAEALKELISENRSLDDIFQRICIPVLLTYDSNCVASAKRCDEAFRMAFEAEIRANHLIFRNLKVAKDIRIHLILLPLKSKTELNAILDRKLKGWQKL